MKKLRNTTHLLATLCISAAPAVLGMHNVNARDADGRTALHHAVYRGLHDQMRRLIAENANVDAGDNQALRPLHYAVQTMWALKAVPILLQAGANPNATNQRGQTPLFSLVNSAKHTPQETDQLIALLLHAGANINAQDRKGATVLHHIAWTCRPLALAQTLIAAGIDINVRTIYGDTPLHLALKSPHVMLAEELIEQGADVDACNRWGQKPLFLVTGLSDGQTDIMQPRLIRRLLARGCDMTE